MKYLGSRRLETDRLILKPQTIQEQKYLWSLLINPEINRYYLTVPIKFREKLKDWNKQQEFYEEAVNHANDKDVFIWSIFLKENDECIGRISCHEANKEDENITNPSIRGVGWFIDPKYQGKGYCTEAARIMIKYMFEECEIDEIKTGAAIENPNSWKIMEKLGFEKQKENKFVQYTYLDNPTEIYCYNLTKEKYIRDKMNIYNNLKKPEELLEFMNQIHYGYKGNDGKIYDDAASELFKNNWYSKCVVQDHLGVLETKIGTCWDQVEFERNWFEVNNYEHKVYFLCYDIEKDHSTHTFVIYKENNNYYWFENAFEKYRGIHKYDSLNELLKDIVSKSIEFNKINYKLKENLENKVVLCEYPKPKTNCSVEEFFNNINKNGKFLEYENLIIKFKR